MVRGERQKVGKKTRSQGTSGCPRKILTHRQGGFADVGHIFGNRPQTLVLGKNSRHALRKMDRQARTNEWPRYYHFEPSHVN